MKERTWIRCVLPTFAAAVSLALATAAPAAGAMRTLADWRMNEGRRTSVMHDDGPKGINGHIGSAVVTGMTAGNSTVYHWPSSDLQGPPIPARLVTVDDHRLNPGTRDFAITIRFRTSRSLGNMIQKGQSGNTGGYFKWEIPNGNLACLFRGHSRSGKTLTEVVHSGDKRLNDGHWHTVRCERTSDQVTMVVDKTYRRKAIGRTGRVHNDVPLTIGGKMNCDQVDVGCDYFVGDIDYVRIQVG